MEGIAAFNKEERAELFLATADQKRLAAPAVEKNPYTNEMMQS